MRKPIHFELSLEDFIRLKEAYPNMKRNHDICNYGVQAVKLYLKSISYVNIEIEKQKVDIQGELNGNLVKFEVKSTCDSFIAFDKLKVSSPKDYKSLVEDQMEIIRVCKVGQQSLDMYFLKHGIDFNLVIEPRWRLSKIRDL